MKKLIFTLFTIFAIFSVQAQLEKVIVEKYYIADATDATDTNGGSIQPGTTTYRIYIDLFPYTVLKSVYGSTGHPVVFESTAPFYNHATDGQTYAKEFLKNVKSSIAMHNVSTQFADGGEFGMGAEIGIATGKLHARGPVGVEQLTTFKYKVRGTGQIRP